MKLIALPDLHGILTHLDVVREVLAAADLILLPGDLSGGGGANEARRVVETIRESNSALLAVPGNWDGAGVDAYLTGEGINLHRRSIRVEGLVFMGVGGALFTPIPGQTPNEVSEADLERFLGEAAAGLDPAEPGVLICHEPPFGTRLDRAGSGLHVGSRVVRAFIERTRPAICFTGHIHEGVGVERLGETWVINPGPLWDGHYAYAELVSGEVRAVDVRPVPPSRG